MEFEKAHELFIQSHLKKRSGERRDRLLRGHQHAEKLFAKKIWWPLRGHFDELHPEYEVLDWRGRPYFTDYCVTPKFKRIIIEIKGFGAHVTGMDRTKYSGELNRELYLQGAGYRILSFAYDDVEQRPELCIQLLRNILNQYEPSGQGTSMSFIAQREIIRLAGFLARPIRPIDVVQHLAINHRTAVQLLQQLCERRLFQPILNEKPTRVTFYRILPAAYELLSRT